MTNSTTFDVSPARVSGAPMDRLAGLSQGARDLASRAMAELARDRFDAAATPLQGALALAPSHPELLRLYAVLSYRRDRGGDAVAALRKALAAWPDDPLILNDLGNALAAVRQIDEAFACWRRACTLAPEFGLAWYNLGRHLHDEGLVAEGEEPLRRAVECMPEHWQARILLGDTWVQRGRIEAGAAAFREVLARHPQIGRAWWDLANIKTVRLSDAEVETLSEQFARTDLAENDRIGIAFALGKALEDRERYAEAFAYFSEANARVARRVQWNPHGFPQLVARILAAFSAPHARAAVPELGDDVVFVVSMPRSGSTLTEQILAAHSAIEGAGELPYLGQVIAEESERRGARFPDWVGSATAADWERMGRRYLALTTRRRARYSRFTDKMPTNWMLVGAIRAMLPGARIVNCRRDPLETCWSCYKQLFAYGQEYTYDLDHLAVYRRAYEHAASRWAALHPQHFRDQAYEALQAEPEAQTRALLDFCGLPFEDACLRFHESARSIRTPSAAQVRQPIRRDTARAVHYGKLLDPLRRALALPDAVPDGGRSAGFGSAA